jgi:starvation-inducible DNA-binding protein
MLDKETLMKDLQKSMSVLLSNFYSLLLKTQNYHWHVKGPYFKELHVFFEEQYTQLFADVDLVAERILTLGFNAPATLKEIAEHRSLSDGHYDISGFEMVTDLIKDYNVIIDNIYDAINVSKKHEDEGNVTFLTDLLVQVEKTLWMLKATSSGF